MNTNDYDLILRSLDEELSAEETRQLRQLLRSSAEARAELDRLQEMRTLISEHGSTSFGTSFTDDVMGRLPHRNGQPTDRKPVAHARPWSMPWQRIGWAVAAAVVLLGVGLAVWLWPQTTYVPYGTTSTATLSDGSTVELSAGSTLRYQHFWGRSQRTVHLDGEAFFDVAPGSRPFIVETFNARVVVTGTRFNVRAWPDEPTAETAVTLASGHVDVTPRAPAARPVTLAPGETSSVLGDTTVTPTPPDSIPLDQALAWRSGGLAFANRPLGSVLRALERRFNVDITLAASALADRPLTYLNPQPASGEDVLSDICHALNLRYRRTADGFTVLRREP